MAETYFLPGAGGSAGFWHAAAAAGGLTGRFFHWPGLGAEPPETGIEGLDDLVALVGREIREPVNLVAQSMGGVVALRAALERPGLVRRLVLVATSGGLPLADLGASDWREEYFAAFPHAAPWIAAPVPDLTACLPGLEMPVLLLWGDADPISPVAVGRRLQALLPKAVLRIVPGAGHDLAHAQAQTVGPMIAEFLRGS